MCLVVPPVLLGGTKGHLVIFAVVMKIVGKKINGKRNERIRDGVEPSAGLLKPLVSPASTTTSTRKISMSVIFKNTNYRKSLLFI